MARSPLPEHAATLAKYKKVMAQQFLDEGRDKYGFVTADGELLGRRNRTIGATSPNYPRSPSPPGPGPAPGNADCSAQTAAALTAGTAVVQVGGGGAGGGGGGWWRRWLEGGGVGRVAAAGGDCGWWWWR